MFFLLKDIFLFRQFFKIWHIWHSRFDIFVLKILIYYCIIRYSQSEKINCCKRFSRKNIFYESNTIKSTHNRFIILYSKYFVVIDLSLILFNTPWGIYSIPKESKYTAVFLSINNGTCIPLLFVSSRFMTYAPYFILGNLFLEKMPLNLGSQLKYLVILILLTGWSRTRNFYPCILLLLF